MLGTSFDQLSVGLAKTWNMGEMLVRSIEDPQSRTPEMRAIGLACDYSSALTDPDSKVSLSGCIKEMSSLAGVSEQKLRLKLKRCTEQSVELAVSYGAKALTKFLDPKADLSRFEYEDVHHKPDEMMQLKMLRELTQIATEQGDLNLLVNTAIEGLHRGVGMDRVIVFMLNQAKDQMKPRFVSCQNADKIETGFVFPITNSGTVFDEAYTKHSSLWVDAPTSEKWRKRLTPALQGLVQGLPFFVAPLVVNKKCIGLIYADRSETHSSLAQDDFSAFNHFAGQLSLCLSLRFLK